jgi:hypothetical protein
VVEASVAITAGGARLRVGLYRDRRSWKQIQLTGRRQDFSWRHSAGEYLRLHNEALRIRQLLHKEQLWTKPRAGTRPIRRTR